jgi:hypothetical protein
LTRAISEGEVVLHQLETGAQEDPHQVLLLLGARIVGVEIVDAGHLVAVGHEPLHDMGTDEPGATGDEDFQGTLHSGFTAETQNRRAKRRPF